MACCRACLLRLWPSECTRAYQQILHASLDRKGKLRVVLAGLLKLPDCLAARENDGVCCASNFTIMPHFLTQGCKAAPRIAYASFGYP